jgi:hypothetical protein
MRSLPREVISKFGAAAEHTAATVRASGDRQRRDQRVGEGQDTPAMGVRLRHRRLSCDRADAQQVCDRLGDRARN